MAKTTNTAEQLDRLALQYQAVIDAAAMLREIGSLENARDEAKKAAADAAAEADAAKADAKKAKDDLKKAKQAAEDVATAASADAARVLAAANSKADEIGAQAKVEASLIIADATQSADSIKAGVHAELLQLQARRDTLTEQLAAADADLAAKLDKFKDVEKRLEQARAKVRALVE